MQKLQILIKFPNERNEIDCILYEIILFDDDIPV